MDKGKRSNEPALSPQQTLERFIYRARRVEDHSLVRSGIVKNYAAPKLTLTVKPSGEGILSKGILIKEESIESLTSRLRPFIVKSEPMYMPKVINAIKKCMEGFSPSEDQIASVEEVRGWFEDRFNSDNAIYRSVQSINKDGNPETDYVSDSVLANSWLYSDLVHADPKGKKVAGTKFDYLTRYEAAVSYFSELSLLVVRLLDIVRDLYNHESIFIPEEKWYESVSIAEALLSRELEVRSGSMYVFPAGTIPPENTPLEEIPDGICIGTSIGSNRVRHDATTVAVYDASDTKVADYTAYQEDTCSYYHLVLEDALRISWHKSSFSLRGSEFEDPILKPIEGQGDLAAKINSTLNESRYFIADLMLNGKSHRLKIELAKEG
ncbi:hypothetical protein [Caniella muris]|uniref:hypothetical protein n=1 Tax=Caniella muris TaxID=2941502 RepID=UPI00203F3F52|nr:hypothetical protein [Caniella muris]